MASTKLPIYVNDRNEIRDLYYSDDKSLRRIVINREEYFGSHTDPYILGYTYEEQKDDNGNVTGVVCTPYVDKHYLEIVEAALNQVTDNEKIAINHSTLDEVIAFHRKAVGKTARNLIEAGVDLDGEHYSLEFYDQLKISTLFAKVAYGGQKYVPWHPDGGNCRLLTADQMLRLGSLVDAYVTYHTSRANMINGMISKCKTKREVLAITYRTPLDDEANANLDNILNPLGITGDIRAYCEASVAAAEDPQGEYYTNAGSMIDPVIYDSEKFMEPAKATVNTDKKTRITTFIIPTTFVDRDKIGDGVANSTTLSPTFKKITLGTQGEIDNELTNDFTAYYVWNQTNDTAYVRVDMVNNNVVSLLLGVGSCYNERTDKVNKEEIIYLIKKDDVQAVTTDYDRVKAAIGYVEPVEEEDVPTYVQGS